MMIGMGLQNIHSVEEYKNYFKSCVKTYNSRKHSEIGMSPDQYLVNGLKDNLPWSFNVPKDYFPFKVREYPNLT